MQAQASGALGGGTGPSWVAEKETLLTAGFLFPSVTDKNMEARNLNGVHELLNTKVSKEVGTDFREEVKRSRPGPLFLKRAGP